MFQAQLCVYYSVNIIYGKKFNSACFAVNLLIANILFGTFVPIPLPLFRNDHSNIIT